MLLYMGIMPQHIPILHTMAVKKETSKLKILWIKKMVNTKQGWHSLDPGDLKSCNFIGLNAGFFFSRSRCPGRRDLLGSIRIVFGGAKCEGTTAVVVVVGLVVDARTLLLSVVVGGAFADLYCWLAASMSRSSSFSESSWSRQDSISSLNNSPDSLNASKPVRCVAKVTTRGRVPRAP